MIMIKKTTHRSSILLLGISLTISMSLFTFMEGISTNVFATAVSQQSYCPPVCLDEVRQHVNEAQEALEDGDLVKTQSELNIVDSLLDQLRDMTSSSD